jgi:hypothetical protein
VLIGTIVRTATRWVADADRPGVSHRAGVAWHRSALPPRLHWCRPQTAEITRARREDGGLHVDGRLWCACGAVADSGSGGRWRGKNRRRALGRMDPAISLPDVPAVTCHEIAAPAS